MLTIYKGSVQEVKKAMKEASKEATVLRTKLVKRVGTRNIGYKRGMTKQDIQDLDMYDRTHAFMVVSKFIPVWVDVPGGQILMNQLMIQELSKRLKGYRVTVTMAKDEVGRMLVFRYTNGKKVSGRFELYELPQELFNLGKAIPKARFEDFVNTNILEGVM